MFCFILSHLFSKTAKSLNIKPMKIKLYEHSIWNKRWPIRGYFVIAMLFLLPLSLLGQQKTFTINGIVKDKSTPLPGVTVILEGTTTGTITDANGNYTLSISSDQSSAQISFNYIGYKKQISPVSLGAQESITVDITLEEEISQLDEIVVVGSTLKSAKRELGNNISTVNASSLEKSGSNNLFSALQGKLPGAQITQNSGDPSGGMTIRLRGVKSLQGNSDPLYVIDGVIVSNATANVSQTALANQVGTGTSLGNNRLVDLNPADVESINVINGAAAAAQYGSRASNGVILITTKKGKQGTPRLTFSTSMNVNELRKKVPITTYGKQFGSAALRLHTIAAQASSVPAVGETVTSITRDGVTSYLRTNQVDVTRYDYQDEIFRTGFGTDNNISLSGGNDKTQYFTSFSYLKNEGIIKGTDFTRYNFRTRIDQRLADWAKLSAGISYANSFANEKANGNVFYSPINSINITNNIYDITQRDAAGNLLSVEPTRVNPLSTIEDMDFTQRVNRTVNDLQLNLTPLKGLGVDWIVGLDTYTQTGRSLIKPYPYQAISNLPAERYPTGFAANASNTVLQFNSDLNVSYERQLSEAFKLNAIIGTNYQYQRSDFQSATGEGLAPFIETVSGATSTTVRAGYGLDQYSLSGYFAQTTVGYKNLAFITAAVRRDKSSKFSPSEANQTYPKVSASFVPSDLEFWNTKIGTSVINSLKLRTSWGQAGNLTGIGSYDRFWQYSPVPFLGRNTIVPSSQLANENVKPERMTELEYGFDVGLLKNKINLSATFYKQNIEDLVVNRGLASSEGGLSIVNNVGEMENKGLEISLNVVPVSTANLTWDVTFIYNRNRNKVTSLGTPTIPISNAAGAPSFLIEGAPASVFYGTTLARNTDGSLLLTPLGLLQNERGTQVSSSPLEYSALRDASGQPLIAGAANIRSVIGDPNPDFSGSFMSNLAYKNFNFNFLLDVVRGVDVFNADKRTRQGVGIGDYVEKELKGELTRGYIYAMYLTEEWRIDDGSFVKLREIGLSYDFKSPFKGVNNVNLGFSGRNLISWDNYNGYDPETNAGGNSDILRGVDFGNVPIPRTYKVQLTVSF
jgi:TonB-linked SusC/RagA family outer membrane protein